MRPPVRLRASGPDESAPLARGAGAWRRQRREPWALPHTEAGWVSTLHRLRGHGEPQGLPVIIEKNSGLVVDLLLAAGHPVVPVHPTSFYAARPRWGASGAKSDPGDSYKLADYLRTDGHRLRRLEPVDPGLGELPRLVTVSGGPQTESEPPGQRWAA